MSDSRATILLVDDEPQNLHILGELLRDDYEIVIATSGREAIKRVQSETPPDLILLDILMPEMDGRDVCIELQANPTTANIPIIFITAMDNVADETHGLEAGAVDYITKPISPAIVKARIRTHLKLKAQTDLLTRLSEQDGLTGLSNRHCFDQRLQQEWRRMARSGELFSIVMMDVDFFKQYNDSYGHSAGDDCLQQVAAALGGVVRRSGEMVARYGGEEFVALLPSIDEAQGLAVAMKFRQKVEALGLKHRKDVASSTVTISVGVACCTPRAFDNPKRLLDAADRMLYAAKRNGRNCVMGTNLDTDELVSAAR